MSSHETEPKSPDPYLDYLLSTLRKRNRALSERCAESVGEKSISLPPLDDPSFAEAIYSRRLATNEATTPDESDLLYYWSVLREMSADVEYAVNSVSSALSIYSSDPEQSSAAVDLLTDAIPSLLEALQMALGILSSTNPNHLIFGTRELRRRREQAQKPYRRAAIEIFRKIIRKQHARTLSEILHWIGTYDFKEVEVEGGRFRFFKSGGDLVIHQIDANGRNLEANRTGLKSSTIYEWRTEAREDP